MSKKNGTEALSRRSFLRSAATVGAAAFAAPAFAQSALDDLINAPRRGKWDDQFDAKAASRTAAATVSNTPILGPDSVPNIQQAIAQYQNIACQRRLAAGQSRPAETSARRHRPVRPGTAPAPRHYRRPAARSGHVACLRLLRRWRGQAFPGPPWPAGGWRARRIYAEGDEHFCRRAPSTARHQSRAPADLPGDLGRRHVMVNIPAAYVEAVENGSVASRHKAVVGRIERPTHLVNSKIYEVILNPYWTAPRIDRRAGHRAADAQGSDLPRKEQHSSDRRQGQRSGARNHRLERREGAEPDVPSGSGQDQRHGLHQDQLLQQERRVHARHAAAGLVQQADAASSRPAAFASRTSAT